MKSLIICGIIFLTLKSIQSETIFEKTFNSLHKEPPPPKIKGRHLILNSIIEQKVDNFNDNDKRTWHMRYKENPEHFKPNGPIFIFLGGEWEITDGFIASGHFYDLARKHNAYLFYTEHRYYGKSYPTNDLQIHNLKYLSVTQALADLAHFIKAQKSKPEFKNSKIIIAGGSYSATMVAWFRQKYPELTVGGWSSSAPLFAKVDFIEYKEIVGQSIKLVGGEKCFNRIENGIKQFELMFENKRYNELKVLLNICDNFDSENKYDVMTLFDTISNIAAGLVQGHNKGDIEKACTTILNEENDIDGVSKWILSYLGNECGDFTYDSNLKIYRNTQITSNIYRQWTYQTCSEFGWYQTSGSKDQPFGSKFPVELYERLCQDIYGITKDNLYKNIENTNKLYGGWEPNVENVFFTHGKLDPWNAMGMKINDDGEDNMIPLYSHCKDFGSISEADTKEMRASKVKFSNLVSKWLNA